MKQFPHEITDLEPLFEALRKIGTLHPEEWETRFILLIWLSLIVINPFDLSIVDSSSEKGSNYSIYSYFFQNIQISAKRFAKEND